MTRKAARIRIEPLIAFGVPLYGGGIALPSMGSQWFVSSEHTGAFGRGDSFDHPLATIQAAVDAAAAGDMIFIAPGDYDEAVTITDADIIVYIGCGGRGNVAVVPSATDGVAITISGTAANRAQDITLINVGGEGNGTGGGLYVYGNIRRIRAIGCKFEGGAFATKLESTAAGSVGDTQFRDCEFAWTTTALHLTVSGAGDPVTNVYVKGCLFHNFTADGVLTSATFADGLWIDDNVFANQEGGTEPTQFLDIDDAGTTGFVCNNVFATTVFSTAKFAIAAGVIFANNVSQAENPSANVGGTSGRPD